MRPWPLTYTPSGWRDPLDALVTSLMPRYNAGVPRDDVEAVRRLFERAGARVPRHVVVVGTNGKTSVATYLARLLTRAGRRTGLYTSPHLRYWTERMQVDMAPVGESALAEALAHVDALAQEQDERAGDLRFFDVLTVAAEMLFAHAGVEVGVFEAGIGGRLDGTRCLDPELVLLTSIGEDHESLLGVEAVQRLREKALAAGPGSTLLSARLGFELEADLRRLADESGFAVEFVDAPGSSFQDANFALASAAASHLGAPADPTVRDAPIDGRWEQGSVRGVPYVADVAHNPTAWEAFLSELPDREHVVVCAITEPRDPGRLVDALVAARAKIAEVVVTGTTVRPARDPEAIARSLAEHGIAASAPEEAFAAAVERAGAADLPLAVFGSNYLVVDFLAWSA